MLGHGVFGEGARSSARMQPGSGREDFSGLSHHQKPAPNGSGKGRSIYPPCPIEAPLSNMNEAYMSSQESRFIWQAMSTVLIFGSGARLKISKG